MDYKGFKIIAEVNVNQQWEIAETDKGILLTNYVDSGEADEAGIEDYIILEESGEYAEEFEAFYDTLDSAKEAIDAKV